MALNLPIPGLRRLVNPSHDVAKVSLSIPAGESVDVSEYVAGQLERQGFKPATDAPAERLTVNVQAPVISRDEAAEILGVVRKGRKGKD